MTSPNTRVTAQFHYIYDMEIDKEGNILLSDADRILKVSPAGEMSTIESGRYLMTGSVTSFTAGLACLFDKSVDRLALVIIDI